VSVFLAVLIIYAPALYLPFQFDDALFLRDDNVRLGRLEAFLVPPAPRLLAWLTFVLQNQWHGFSPAHFHAFNVVVHALNAVLVCAVLFLLIGDVGDKRRQFHSGVSASSLESRATAAGIAALVGALVFALHPVQTEPVYYVYQRSTLLAAFFCLLALIAYIRNHTFWASAFFVAAAGCKEFAVILPAVLWLFDWVWRKRLKPSRTVGILSFIALVVAAWDVFFSGGVAETSSGQVFRDSASYGLRQVSVFWSYLSLVFLGGPLNLDHHVRDSVSLLDPGWWLGALSLVILLVLVIVLREKHPLDAFSCGAFLLFLVPTSSVVPSPDALSEHRLYSSMLGWAGITAGCFIFLMKFGASRNTGWSRRTVQLGAVLGVGVLLAFCAVSVVKRGEVWEDPVRLWRDTVSKSPGKYRPNYNLGVLLMDSAPAEAAFYLNRAVSLDPSQPLAYRTLGEIYFRSGDLQSAEKAWRLALSVGRGDPDAHIALGRLFIHRKDFLEAHKHLLAARDLEPRNLDVCYYLALANFQFGFLDNAIAECEKGLNIDGTRHRLRVLLADVVAQTGNWARAIELYRENLESVDESQVYFKLARAYQANGQAEEARKSIREGIRVAKSREDVRFGFWLQNRLP